MGRGGVSTPPHSRGGPRAGPPAVRVGTPGARLANNTHQPECVIASYWIHFSLNPTGTVAAEAENGLASMTSYRCVDAPAAQLNSDRLCPSFHPHQNSSLARFSTRPILGYGRHNVTFFAVIDFLGWYPSPQTRTFCPCGYLSGGRLSRLP